MMISVVLKLVGKRTRWVMQDACIARGGENFIVAKLFYTSSIMCIG